MLVLLEHGPQRQGGGHRVEHGVGDARGPTVVRSTELGRRFDGKESPRNMLVEERGVFALEGDRVEIPAQVNKVEA